MFSTPTGLPTATNLAVIDNRSGDNWRLQYPIGKIFFQGHQLAQRGSRISPDGNQRSASSITLAVSATTAAMSLVIDRAGHLELSLPDGKPSKVFPGPPPARKIWFSSATSGEQFCIHAVTLAGKQRIVFCGTTGVRIHDIASSGRALITTGNARRYLAAVRHGSAEIRDITWLDASILPILSADGTHVLFTDVSSAAGNTYATYVRKTDGSPALHIGDGGFGAAINSKSALMILVDNPSASVQIVPLGAGQAKPLNWNGF